MTQAEPKLEPPGKGLRWYEYIAARYILFPSATRKMTKEHAIAVLNKNGKLCLEKARSLSSADLKTQVLIPRIRGIEDSSRYWSVLMTIEHLLITGKAMRNFVQMLAAGKTSDMIVRVEDVKPTTDGPPETILNEYQEYLDGYNEAVTSCNDLKKTPKHWHPWFGPINAHQWLCLNGIHHKIHLNQIDEITKQL